MGFVPMVKDEKSSSDLFSRLLKDRIILVTGEVNDQMAEMVMAQLLYLDSEDPEKDIVMYINSGGGSITSGMAIFDTMNIINADVSTVCIGIAASMGAFLLSAGKKGKRFITENAEVMIHQPLGGISGMTQATDMEITTKRILRMKEKLTQKLAKHCDQPYEKVKDDCERDYWLESNEALEYGIVDSILFENENSN